MALYSPEGSGGPFTISVRGREKVEEVLDRLSDFHRQPGAKRVLGRAVGLIVRDAKRFSPADTGRLRSSIDGVIDRTAGSFDIKVGSKVHYAPYMERGTGTLVGRPPHWPPGDALASRTGM